MNCPTCKRETQPSLFCQFCDEYLAMPGIGTRAGVARRFAAQLLDGISVWVIFLAVLAFAGAIGAGSQSAGLSFTTFVWALIGYVVFALWFLSQGKTPGKWLLGIRVVDKRQGSLPGLGRMIVREVIGKFVSGLFLGIGYFWAIFDRDNQAWHDKIAGTVVVRQTAGQPDVSGQSSPSFYAAAAGASLSSPTARPDTPAAPGTPTQSQSVSRFCSQCGAKYQPGSRFCGSCSAPV